MKKLLAASAVTLGLLGSSLSAAHASEDPAAASEIPGQAVSRAASAAGDDVPLPEDLDESSTELDDEISQPVPETEDEAPFVMGATPGDEGSQEEGIENPDPLAGAQNPSITCRARLLIAMRDGSEEPITCATWDSTPSVAPLRASVSAWPTPNWCDDHGVSGKWYVNRFKACGIFSATASVINPRTGTVTGTLHYLVRAYAYSGRDVPNWAYQVELMEVSSTGTAKGMSASGRVKCSGKCKVTKSTFPSQAMSQNKDAVGQFFLQTTIKTSPKGQKGDGQASASWVFTKAGATPSNEISLPTPPVRCDNALPGTSKPGCVMPYIPEMVYAKAGEYPELAKHIEDAQNTQNLPGKHGTTRYLTRLTDRTKIKENRDTSCPSSLTRPPGKQCDEYPFASTWQGAKTGGSYSRRMIAATQNEGGGRALGNFYLYNRIIEKDRFLVWIK
ncbi:NucA/NucB deoxyribonuclease domain-containing protein [Streptomyces antibioticus]|uniref:NucA/NucB deoxyribonuclease domain-containing protein n=1 Tax=Streptomyces antibioticus TaxID=1890 RepID=UPI003D71EECE